jgi:hypothetical protein
VAVVASKLAVGVESRPEIKTPVADAMRLVDHDQAHPGQQSAQPRRKARVAQTLGRDQQHVDGVCVQLLEDFIPIVNVRGVDRGGLQPRPLGRAHLIAHQRQQGRHHQRRPSARAADRVRGRPVHRRLAPTGGLHYQHPRGRLQHRVHGVHLIGARHSTRPGQPGQDGVHVLFGECALKHLQVRCCAHGSPCRLLRLV